MTDVDRLPPTQYLVLEVLAARLRLGDEWWPFPTRLSAALQNLERAGLIERDRGSRPREVQAGLTAAGRLALLDDGYGSTNKVEQMRRALKLIAEFAGMQADLVPGMRSVAEIARNGLAG